MHHAKRKFPISLDYSPGYLDWPGDRERAGLPPGGPSAVIINFGVMSFDEFFEPEPESDPEPEYPHLRSGLEYRQGRLPAQVPPPDAQADFIHFVSPYTRGQAWRTRIVIVEKQKAGQERDKTLPTQKGVTPKLT